jgi:hypothetical protein
VPDQEIRHHHGSHRGLLQPAAEPGPGGPGIDAIIVPTARKPAYLAEVAGLAEELRCPLVTLHSTKWTTAAEAARRIEGDVDLIAVDIPDPGRLHLPDWETSRLLAGTVFARRTDVSAKRNLALMLSHMLGWSRVLFMDDDITKLDPDDVRRAGGLLGTHSAVGLRNDGYPDNSVVCHAYRLAGGPQTAFVGAGALAVELSSRSFFPDIYNDDWFFLLDGDMRLRPTTTTGHVYQHAYDPFRSPARARGEELGDVLAEGLYWLLDQERSITEADASHWSMFLARRGRFIEEVLKMVEAAVIEPREEKARRIAALKGSLGRLALITPALCEQFLRAWAADRTQWKRHLEQLPAGQHLLDALPRLSPAGSPRLNWRRREPAGRRTLTSFQHADSEPGGVPAVNVDITTGGSRAAPAAGRVTPGWRPGRTRG